MLPFVDGFNVYEQQILAYHRYAGLCFLVPVKWMLAFLDSSRRVRVTASSVDGLL